MSSKVHVLNLAASDGRRPAGAARRPPGALATELQKSMLQLKGEFMSEDGRQVYYTQLKSSQLFKDYEILARQLCDCDLMALQEETEKKAFFISILNNKIGHSAVMRT